MALACSDPPEGQARWSLRLLADRMVELEVVGTDPRRDRKKDSEKTNSSLT